MAKELLDWGETLDLSKCDIFSLGISGKNKIIPCLKIIINYFIIFMIVYELYTRSSLEPNGPKWHEIREGVIPLPFNTPEKLSSIIVQLMSPEPIHRPSAKSCIQFFTELKTPLEIELEKQKNIALQLEQQLEQLMNSEQQQQT